ncbi:MAG: DNA polymerase/3'-5' exonuclease PolX [Spirochaetes bacterium]|nr:DNA polymerase/3'-5' exonuclease PolX [Spirochaetota bacterium]
MENQKLAQMFDKIADALEIKGENRFKIIAYRKASQILNNLTSDIYDHYQNDELQKIPGIGEGIAKKIKEYFETGQIKKLKEAFQGLPESLLDLLSIPSLGPRTVALAYQKLKVKNLQDLEKAIRNGSLASLPGMGEKKIDNIMKGIEFLKKALGRIPLGKAFVMVNELLKELSGWEEIKQISPAGSYRRMKETVGDIDILVTSDDPKKVMDQFTALDIVARVKAKGPTRSSIETDEGFQVDLRIVDDTSFGAALQYFTGSKAHNVKLRSLAKDKGLKINEYGVFKDEKYVAGKTEEQVYQALGLEFIPPEMREDLGEIELAQKKIPRIISYDHFPGDLHIHSTYSDGESSLKEIVEEAMKYGYKFVGIADHSKSVKYAGGLSIEKLLEKNDEIDKLQKQYPKIRILKAAEVDILIDGSLDYPDHILSQLDVVIAAIHTGFSNDPEGRILKAMDNQYVHIIAHPTGRLLSQREAYNVDMDKLLEKASRSKKAMEINAYWDRLDLNDYDCRKAREHGVKLAIGTDSHHISGMWQMVLGIGVARRAWLTKKDIYNFDI